MAKVLGFLVVLILLSLGVKIAFAALHFTVAVAWYATLGVFGLGLLAGTAFLLKGRT